MFDKLKQIFNSENNSNKKIENLVIFLVILVITLMVIKYILKDDSDVTENVNLNTTATLASSKTENYYDLEEKLEKILSKIDGVGDVSVLITYSETSSTIAMYNEKNTTSITEETDQSGGVRKITSEDYSKEIIEDKDSNPITQKVILPQIEGSVVIAQGGSNPTVKVNIISAVEAATGLAIHKIQVFEMKD